MIREDKKNPYNNVENFSEERNKCYRIIGLDFFF